MNLLSRRNLLSGAGLGAGGLLLSPLLRDLDAQAAGVAAKKRLVVFQTANGFSASRYRQANAPKPDLAAVDAPIALTEVMAPLEPYKKDVLLVEGFFNPFVKDLHGNGFAALSVCQAADNDHAGGISFDRYVAKQIGGQSAFSSLCLAGVWHNSDPFARSADDLDKPYPAVYDPAKAYAQIFGSGLAVPGQATQDQLLARNKRLLDFVSGDVQRLKPRLSAAEAAKLDQYLESTSALESQLQKLQASRLDCSNIQAPPPATMATIAGDDNAYVGQDPVIEAHISLAANALACGLTQVVAIALGTSCGVISHYGFSALKNSGDHHKYCHASDLAALAEIDTYVMSKVAGFMRRLHAIPEGDGSMADNTIVLVVNDGGGNHHDGWDDIPILMIGNAGGNLRTGRLVSLPLKTYCPSDLFVSVANALGIATSTFGDPTRCKGPLAALA